jgi:tRNA dimethylallyltransferase
MILPSKTLITIVGPTGIGKTRLSIALAQALGCEIISCDSRQFYKEMRIGTAVPSHEELTLVKHHFIQNRSISEDYSVGQFEKDALLLLNDLFIQYDYVVMVGGSGLYVQAVLEGLDAFPDVSPQIRNELKQELELNGLEHLQEKLKQLDPETYDQIELSNPHRVIRALEICMETGEKYASFKAKPKEPRPFQSILIGLDAPRKEIYKRIELRVDAMLEEGLLEEAKLLFPQRHLNALQTVGYRELFDYMEGKTTLDFALSEIKKNSRRYAKRQNTWFKRNPEIQWFDYQTELSEILKCIPLKS